MPRRRTIIWEAAALAPTTHTMRLLPNYADARHDPDALILELFQRTTGTGQSIRLERRALVDLAVWLRTPQDALHSVHVAAVATGGHVDLLGVSWTREDVLVWVAHRADDYPQTARVLIYPLEALALAQAIVDCDDGVTVVDGLRPVRVVDVSLPD